jgi:hypothetical protein
MRDRALSLLIPTSPPLGLGIVVAVALIAAQTLVVYPERSVAAEIWLGVVDLPEVMVVSTVWGVALGAAAVLSIAAFDFFHVPSALRFVRAVPAGAGGTRDLSVRSPVAIERGAVAAGKCRVRGGVVASVDVLLRAAREREGMGSALER